MQIYKKILVMFFPLLLATNGVANIETSEKKIKVQATSTQVAKKVSEDIGKTAIKVAPFFASGYAGYVGAFVGASLSLPTAVLGLVLGISGTGGFVSGVVPICIAVAASGPIAGFAIGSTIGYLGAKGAIYIGSASKDLASEYIDHVSYVEQTEDEADIISKG